jgi:anti-anti-sigma factor
MKIRKEGTTLTLIPESDLTASRIEEMRDYFSVQLKQHSDFTHIRLDADGIGVVDSLGVNLIVGLYREAMSKSATIDIVGAGENFIKVANFFRLPSLFPIKKAEI